MCCSICYMVGTEEESFEWLDVDKVPNELRILQDTVDVLSLPRPGEVSFQQPVTRQRQQCRREDAPSWLLLQHQAKYRAEMGFRS